MTNQNKKIENEKLKKTIEEITRKEILQLFPLEKPLELPFPWFFPVSGLYEWRLIIDLPQPIPYPYPEPIPPRIPIPEPEPRPTPFPKPEPDPPSPPYAQHFQSSSSLRRTLTPLFMREELRLDVDRHYPQVVASGALFLPFRSVHWIANLNVSKTGWSGNIWYKDGDTTFFPYTDVEIKVKDRWLPFQRKAIVTFSGGGRIPLIRTYTYKSRFFHPVDFEFDYAEGEDPTLTYETCSHPNRPADLRCEDLSIQDVFRRAGFNVTTTHGDSVPISLADADAEWSDQEMHDAMQTYWSHFESKPQWAIWVFFASLHEMGNNLGGIMFDSIGPNHRQGTAIFNDSFISEAPTGETDSEEWIRRNIFWTACHEMGHTFNLAHSWQKSLGTPWIPLVDEPEARSFMNYPFVVNGGESAFFSDFEFRFSDGELLFLRHAPVRFVQQGNADWFDNHGFQGLEVSEAPSFKLELRVNRERPLFEFMEPVNIELKLTNISSENQNVDKRILALSDSLIIIIKQLGKSAKQYIPYARYLWMDEKKVLEPNESIYEAHSISAGLNGWDIAQPGPYEIKAALKLDSETIISNTIQVYIKYPENWEEEMLSRSLFTDEIGRILVFKGSQYFIEGNKILKDVAEKFSNRNIAFHANYVLGNTVLREYKQLVRIPESKGKGLEIKVIPPNIRKARQLLSTALVTQPTTSAETFGHIPFKRQVDQYSNWLIAQDERDEAVNTQQILLDTMTARRVRDRPILSSVINQIKEQRDKYQDEK